MLVAPAETDHAVVFGPVSERIVRGMKGQQTASAPHVSFQRPLDGSRPANVGVTNVVPIENHNAIIGERRAPTRPTRIIRCFGSGRDVDLEQAGFGESRREKSCRLAPIVIVQPVDDEGLDWRSGHGLLRHTGTRPEQQADCNQQRRWPRSWVHSVGAGRAADQDIEIVPPNEARRQVQEARHQIECRLAPTAAESPRPSCQHKPGRPLDESCAPCRRGGSTLAMRSREMAAASPMRVNRDLPERPAAGRTASGTGIDSAK